MHPPELTIRPIEAADEEGWRRLWTDYLAFYETTLPEAIFEQTFARIVADAHPGPFGMLAVADGRPVGLVHYIFHRSCWKIEESCYLQDLYVEPGTRGGGVGRKLIETVYARADAAGNPRVYWLTQEFNYRGRMLYDSVGVRTPFIRYDRPS